MLSQEQRAAIVTEAKSWAEAKTPYRGWSCVKGAGVDCGQLLYGVFLNCGFVPGRELPKDYSLQVASHRASTEYIDIVNEYCTEIPEADVQPGDIVVYKLGHAFAHAAIVVSWPGYVIQADVRHGVSGAHGTKTPVFRHAERTFRTLRDEFTGAK